MPEQPRQFGKDQFLQPQNVRIRRNIENLDADYRPGIDPFDHDMRGRAKITGLVVEREMRGNLPWIMRRSGMKIIGAETERAEDSRRHHHGRDKSDQSCARKHALVECLQLVQGFGRPNVQLRIVLPQDGRQCRFFDRSGEHDDGIEHASPQTLRPAPEIPSMETLRDCALSRHVDQVRGRR